MTADRTSADRVVDRVWARALGQIMKEGDGGSLRPGLGDEINMYIPQSVTTALLTTNPAFARVLYGSGESSAKRNACLIVRRLGMPPDFFWKFDHWSDERAYETLRKLIEKVFASLMSRQKAGVLELVSVDVEQARFEITFASCVECHGVTCEQPICFFHAGVFDGIMEALLGKEFDAYEESCTASGGDVCRFIVGPRERREVAAAWTNGLQPSPPG